MSHELRTPLNAIGGYAELLDRGLRGPVTEAQRADLARIRHSQQHLLGLINDILNFSRIDAGRVSCALDTVGLDPVLARPHAQRGDGGHRARPVDQPRALARGMRGELTVQSEVGSDATFTLTLPRA